MVMGMADCNKCIHLPVCGKLIYCTVNGNVVCDHYLETKQATSNENKRWIPVSERLPDTWKAVIVCRDFDFPDCISIEWRTLTKEWSNDNAHNPNVTHWMPLPEPPKEV